MTGTPRVALMGASGFSGRAIHRHLADVGTDVLPLSAPRLQGRLDSLPRMAEQLPPAIVEDVGELLSGCDVLVNAAGLATATSGDAGPLVGANALLPALLQQAARGAGVTRFIQISSAGVQGRLAPLDESTQRFPSSPYTRSKSLGEELLDELWWEGTVILRPTSVHGPGRPVTDRVARLARSGFAVVAASGTDPTPQVHVRQVARSVEILTDLALAPPHTVLQPWEGFSTASFLTLLGGKPPRMVPRALVRSSLHAAYATPGVRTGRLWATARRLEMLMLGQTQRSGWLETMDHSLTRPHPAWRELP
jgi:nucleoside-diphosphate-sugar epimerase